MLRSTLGQSFRGLCSSALTAVLVLAAAAVTLVPAAGPAAHRVDLMSSPDAADRGQRAAAGRTTTISRFATTVVRQRRPAKVADVVSVTGPPARKVLLQVQGSSGPWRTVSTIRSDRRHEVTAVLAPA